MTPRSLKTRTAHTLKWSLVDRISTQVLYAVTGIVLARALSPSDFGLVGAALVFQAFATLLVDGGFGYALLQRKRPTRLDYSTVLWFNIAVAVAMYIVLALCAPLIADCFQGDRRLIPVARVLFLSLIANAATIVQTNRLTKAMDVRGIALANSLALIAGGVAGIALALTGAGVWAIVGQTLVLAVVKCIVLWTATRWRPLLRFSWPALKSYFPLGWKMMLTSFMNIVYVNIYSLLNGNRIGLVSLGYYTQADKWSKMGVSSLTQVLTSSFLPALSAVQDDNDRFGRLCSKMTRFTAYALFPAMLWLAVTAKPLFHSLFGDKWDASIILFQLLLLRGIAVVLTSMATNFLLAKGCGRDIVHMEILRDGSAVAALAITFPVMAIATPDNPVLGLEYMLWGQLAAAVLSWAVTVHIALRRYAGLWAGYVRDIAPYAALSMLTIPCMLAVGNAFPEPWTQLAAELAAGAAVYLGINAILRSRIQAEAIAFLTKGQQPR